MFLVADIGGTKTQLALYAKIGDLHPIKENTYLTRQYSDLNSILTQFLTDVPNPLNQATLAVCGTVTEDECKAVNLPWSVNASAIAGAIGIERIKLLNDLEAMAYGLLTLGQSDMRVVKSGHSEPNGTVALIAPGTGLGEAFLVWGSTGYVVCASEGGHSSFSPNSELELELYLFLRKQYGHVSFDRVCSGNGIANIHQFLVHTSKYPQISSVEDAIKTAEDATPIIVSAATEFRDSVYYLSVELFLQILAAEIGNLALRFLATGGIYIAGGVFARVRSMLAPSFTSQISAKGRFRDFLQTIPVYEVIVPSLALSGCLNYIRLGKS